MDLLDLDNDEEIRDRIGRLRAPRIFNERINYFEIYNEQEFRRRFRLTKNTFLNLLAQIYTDIQPKSNMNRAIDARTKLLLSLRFYATGSMLLVAADFSGVSEASACIIVNDVSKAIVSLRPQYIKMPATLDEIHNIQLKFFAIAKFPKVIGAIDCTHVEIQSPGGADAEYYRNRKGLFSWNVQTICDADLKILDIVARWPGSSHDQTIFNNSLVNAKLVNGNFGDGIILGDSGYGNTNFLMTPLHNPITPEDQLYNEAQIRTRNCVERSYDVWKRRFPILSLGMRVSLEKSQTVIIVTAVLHNLAIIDGNDMPADEPDIIAAIRTDIENNIQPLSDQIQISNTERRSTLVKDYFKNLL